LHTYVVTSYLVLPKHITIILKILKYKLLNFDFNVLYTYMYNIFYAVPSKMNQLNRHNIINDVVVIMCIYFSIIADSNVVYMKETKSQRLKQRARLTRPPRFIHALKPLGVRFSHGRWGGGSVQRAWVLKNACVIN